VGAERRVAGPGGVIPGYVGPPGSGRAGRSPTLVVRVVRGDDPAAGRRVGMALDGTPAEAVRGGAPVRGAARAGRLDPGEAGGEAVDPRGDARVQPSGGRRADRRDRRFDGRPGRPGSPVRAARRDTAPPVRDAGHGTVAAVAPAPVPSRRPCYRLCRRLCRRPSHCLGRHEPADPSADRHRPCAACPSVGQP
jgi:hypothetical protein